MFHVFGTQKKVECAKKGTQDVKQCRQYCASLFNGYPLGSWVFQQQEDANADKSDTDGFLARGHAADKEGDGNQVQTDHVVEHICLCFDKVLSGKKQTTGPQHAANKRTQQKTVLLRCHQAAVVDCRTFAYVFCCCGCNIDDDVETGAPCVFGENTFNWEKVGNGTDRTASQNCQKQHNNAQKLPRRMLFYQNWSLTKQGRWINQTFVRLE